MNKRYKLIFACIAVIFLYSCDILPPGIFDELLKKPSPSPSAGSTNNTVVNSSDIDTARNVSYLNTLEKDVILELNKLRTNPEQYAKTRVAEVKSYYSGSLLKYPGEIAIQTNEGVAAVDECSNFLLKAKPLPAFQPSEGLSKAARDLVNDQSATSNTSHTGTDGSTPFDRMNRYGKWQITAAENIDYGANIAERIVLSLIIDDGVPDRGHRENIFNEKLKAIGVASGSHQKYKNMFVMDMAGTYQEK